MKLKRLKSGLIFTTVFSLTLGGISVQAQEMNNVGTGSHQVQVTYDVEDNFAVEIPKTIILQDVDDHQEAEYTVKVTGTLSAGNAVNVVPDETFTLSNAAKTGVQGSVTQDKTNFTATEINAAEGISTTGNVTAKLNFGSWKGNFNFTISTGDAGSGDSGIDGGDTDDGSGNSGGTGGDTGGDTDIGGGGSDSDDGQYSLLRSTAGETSQGTDSSHGFLGSLTDSKGAWRNSIRNVYFVDYEDGVGHYIEDNGCWDASEAQDGSIKAWQSGTTYPRDIYIAPAKKGIVIRVNENMSNFFADFDNLGKDREIKGLEKLDFTGVKDLSYMFDSTGGIHFSGANAFNVDTREVTDISGMFSAANMVDADTLGTSISFGDKVDFSNVKKADNVLSYQKDLLVTPEFPGLKVYGKGFYSGCKSLSLINIPEGVTELGSGCFMDCTELRTVNFPDSLESLGSLMFYGCVGLWNISIPDKVTSIPSGCFQNCRMLTDVVLPSSITRIESDAFKGCTSLSTIKFKGTEDQWNAISKESGWNGGRTINIVYNY